MNWLNLIDPVCRDVFNNELYKINENCVDLECEECCKHMVKTVAKVAKEVKSNYKVWFRESRCMIMPLLKERNRLLVEAIKNTKLIKKIMCVSSKYTQRIKDVKNESQLKGT